ncbi:MAG: hypothetical protein IID09_01560 [Candidatus Hydrogenedentes bacterium]|nr:hypothetical protein [Candidatus Hydrogenedentota bacterium]
MIVKACFGQLANMKIAYNNSTRKHYLRVDDEKLKECDQCPLFGKCMFLRYNELMKEMLGLIDESGDAEQRPRL